MTIMNNNGDKIMNDARIHLLLQYDDKYSDWDNKLIFPNGKELFLIGIDALEALVRSLVGHGGGVNKIEHYYCAICNTKLHWNETRHETQHCPQCGQFYYRIHLYDGKLINYITKIEEQQYWDNKLKVTFGSGTWIKDCKELKEFCPDDCNNCPKKEPKVIELLAKIEQLCRELGVEIIYA